MGAGSCAGSRTSVLRMTPGTTGGQEAPLLPSLPVPPPCASPTQTIVPGGPKPRLTFLSLHELRVHQHNTICTKERDREARETKATRGLPWRWRFFIAHSNCVHYGKIKQRENKSHLRFHSPEIPTAQISAQSFPQMYMHPCMSLLQRGRQRERPYSTYYSVNCLPHSSTLQTMHTHTHTLTMYSSDQWLPHCSKE